MDKPDAGAPAWEITQGVDANAHKITLAPLSGRTGADAERWALVTSDWHWDNPYCRRDLLKRHLDQAAERGAPVLVLGDLFCAMQGRYDNRRSMDAVRPEHTCDDYLDALLDTAEEWLAPYKDHLALICPGNHETAIRKNNGVDLTQQLVSRLRRIGSPVQVGGYMGFVRWQFRRSHWRSSLVQFHHHGWGGGAPVTKGAIQFNRLAEQVTADIFVMGHIHRQMDIPNVRLSLSRQNRIVRKPVLYVRTSTYKQESNRGGWHDQRGAGPRPLGSYWLRFRYMEQVDEGERSVFIDTKAIATDGI